MAQQPKDETTNLTPERLPYEPPRIEESGAFERLVLECVLRPDTACTADGEEFGSSG